MAKAKKTCIEAETLLLEIDEALYALDRAQKKAKKIAKKQRKAIDALLRFEASIEDGKKCVCCADEKPKKKKKKKSKKKKKVEVVHAETSNFVADDVSDAQDDTPDDLELIAGVGPTLANKLNELGVHRYNQIAEWQDEDIKRIDLHLNFPGRIVRENWVEQAKALAKGGRDEYVRVFGKEPR